MTNPEIGQSIVANGIRTNYIEAGDPSLPALVLIHGSGPGVTAFANWNGVIPALSEHFHVLAPDMVGFGYTEVPEEFSTVRWFVVVDRGWQVAVGCQFLVGEWAGIGKECEQAVHTLAVE